MALFQPPTPPEGYEYVVRDQNYVLVPKSELTEDICAATGRTWAEEARLYNIRNAPDGKEIAEPGDPFYQTAESMKNRGKELKGVGAAGLGFFTQMQNTQETPGPSLQDTISKIKSGEANADIGAALGNISGIAGNLPSNLSGDLASAQADIAAKISAAQADLPKLMAIAQANMDLTTKIAASQGRAPTEAELKAASGALSIFQDGPALLKSKAEGIGKEIAEAGEEFGAAVPKGIKDAAGAISAGLGKITDAAKAAATAIGNALSGVPSPTIPDPSNPGETITNPAYTTFAADPANAATVTSFQGVLSKVQAKAADLTAGFGEIETAQNTAVAGGVADLKAFAFAAQLAQPATGIMAQAKSLSVDPASFDAARLKQTFSFASKLGPSIDTSLYKDTPDKDLTYTGDDGIVWDRTNAERERRGLPGLAAIGSPRPEDPPLVPAGSTPPKPPEDSVKVATEPKEPPPKATPKVAVFQKDPNENIGPIFLQTYFNILQPWEGALEEAQKNLPQAAEQWYGEAIPGGYIALRDRKNQIEKDKPDPSTRTEQEKATVKQQLEFRDLFITKSQYYRRSEFFRARRNEVAASYNIIKSAFESNATFGSLPKSVEDVVLKDEGPKSWRTSLPSPVYSTYKDYLDNKPYIPPGGINT